MKARESGMPDEDLWDSFYDAACIVEKLECARGGEAHIVEFGSGYGTFTLPVAGRTSGIVHAIDIEAELVGRLDQRARQAGLENVHAMTRDFVESGTGLPADSLDHAMAYNILHMENPVQLLKEALRVLKPGATASAIHWKRDPSTPRGPSMDIRPSPEQCRAWGEEAGFHFLRYQDLSECCAYHFGLLFRKP
jgi:SAM-dependent methyltransferase